MWRLQHLRHQEGHGHLCTSRSAGAVDGPLCRYHTGNPFACHQWDLFSRLSNHLLQQLTCDILCVFSTGHWTNGDLVWLSGCDSSHRGEMKFHPLAQFNNLSFVHIAFNKPIFLHKLRLPWIFLLNKSDIWKHLLHSATVQKSNVTFVHTKANTLLLYHHNHRQDNGVKR